MALLILAHHFTAIDPPELVEPWVCIEFDSECNPSRRLAVAQFWSDSVVELTIKAHILRLLLLSLIASVCVRFTRFHKTVVTSYGRTVALNLSKLPYGGQVPYIDVFAVLSFVEILLLPTVIKLLFHYSLKHFNSWNMISVLNMALIFPGRAFVQCNGQDFAIVRLRVE